MVSDSGGLSFVEAEEEGEMTIAVPEESVIEQSDTIQLGGSEEEVTMVTHVQHLMSGDDSAL